VSPAARRTWRALPAAAQDLERLADDDPRLKLRAVALLDLLADGRIDGVELKEMAFYGDLSGCFKYYFGATGGDITHRIVYRRLADGGLEVIEAIAVEQRDDGYVYLLASNRIGSLPTSSRKALNRVHQSVIARRTSQRDRRRRQPPST
jgi:hypothetical protein